MHNFRKILLSVCLFCAFFFLISLGIIEFYLQGENSYYQDKTARNEAAGTIDFMIVGASRAAHCISTWVIDEDLSVNSYNLGAPDLGMRARYELLSYELARNPVETVILEVSPDAVYGYEGFHVVQGGVDYMARMENLSQQLSFFATEFYPDQYAEAYGLLLSNGVECLKRYCQGRYVTRYESELMNKGFSLYMAKEPNDQTADYPNIYRIQSVDTTIDQKSVDYLQRMVDLCKEQGIRVVLAEVPVSKKLLSKRNGFQEAHDWFAEFAEENGVEYYDFNLYRNREKVFADDNSFIDEQHMWTDGTNNFTHLLCAYMNKTEMGEDYVQDFYLNYEELEEELIFAGEDE